MLSTYLDSNTGAIVLSYLRFEDAYKFGEFQTELVRIYSDSEDVFDFLLEQKPVPLVLIKIILEKTDVYNYICNISNSELIRLLDLEPKLQILYLYMFNFSEEVLDRMNRFLSESSVKSISFSHCNVSFIDLQRITSVSHIKTFSSKSNSIDQNCINFIVDYYHNLLDLSIIYNYIKFDKSIDLTGIAKISSLQTLNLSSNKLSGNTLVNLMMALEENKTIRSLNISYNEIETPIEAESIAKMIQKNKSIFKVNLEAMFYEPTYILIIIDSLDQNKTITCLNMNHNIFNRFCYYKLGQIITVNHNLIDLELEEIDSITDGHIDLILNQLTLSKIQSLNLYDNTLGKDQIDKVLSAELTSLVLSGVMNPADNHDMLDQLITHKTLKKLRIKFNWKDKDLFDHVCRFISMNKVLEELDLEQISLTDLQICKLFEALKISNLKDFSIYLLECKNIEEYEFEAKKIPMKIMLINLE